MIGLKSQSRKSTRDEGEKPFWISYSDMMTALMVLFLVSLTVALLAVTNEVSVAEKAKSDRDKEIQELLTKIRRSTKEFPGVTIHGSTIDFGDQVQFETDSHKLTRVQELKLRKFIPTVLTVARDPLGRKWIRRVIVEGFADKRGTYLHNLNLSLQRSQRVLCTLLAKSQSDETPLTNKDKLLIREIFLVGGSSFNSLKDTLHESRRIEIKLEFLDLGEKRPLTPNLPMDDNQLCPLDCS
jgi:outer membrane protein OmpA-like peptidoglycan-associated protein